MLITTLKMLTDVNYHTEDVTVVNYHTDGSRAWPLTPLAWEPFCNGSSETNYLMICLSEEIFFTSAHLSEVISLLIRKNIIDVANGSIIIFPYICSYKEISRYLWSSAHVRKYLWWCKMSLSSFFMFLQSSKAKYHYKARLWSARPWRGWYGGSWLSSSSTSSS